MSMTTELAQRMKAAALNATQGEWRWERDGGFSYLLAEGGTSPEHRIIDDGSAWGEYAETISPDSFDAAHISTSCPQNVLALVEALEARDKQIAELRAKDINVKRQAQALFDAIQNPGDAYIPAYVRCLRNALAGVAVEGE
ncbi:ead/Ea22-like family protein [Escherichia coli]